MKKLIYILALFITVDSFSQGTQCSAPVVLTPNGACGSGSITDGTLGGMTAPTCGTAGNEGWYSFTATNTSATITAISGNRQLVIQVLSGTCPTLTQIGCANANTSNGAQTETVTVTGLTIGTVYFVRILNEGTQSMTLSSLCITAPLSAPLNDNCTGAFPLTVNPTTTCTTVTAGTVESATASSQSSASCGGTEDDDVWFSFVATAASHTVSLTNVIGSTTDMYHSIWSGTCPTLTLVAGTCSDNDAQTLSGLTIGTTYYVRVYTWTATTGQNTDFNVCIGTPPAGPTNDDPCGATPLTINATCVFTAGTNVNATNSSGPPAPGCASYNGQDVWFSITVPASGAVDFDSNTGTMTDGGMAIYSGTCGSLTLLNCNDDGSNNGAMPYISQTGLTPGSTIWIRFWDYGGGTGTFSICASDPCPTCSGNPTGGSAVASVANITCAAPTTTLSLSGSSTGCSFSFQWQSSPNNSTWTDITGATSPTYVTTVTSTTYFRCRITCNISSGVSFSASVMVTTSATPPTNDEPCSATTLTVGTTCSFNSYTTSCASPSSGVPAPGCSFYNGGDVWFQVTVPASGHLIFDSNTGGITDGGMAIYSGTCSSLTLIECDDDESNNGAMPFINNNSLTAGTTVWVRFWEYGNDAPGTFSICVYDGFINLPGANCLTAVNIPSIPYSQTGQTTCGFGDEYDNSDACGSWYMNGDDYVYSYTPSTNQSIDVTLTNTGTYTGVFVTAGCPSTGTCVGYDESFSGNPSVTCVALTAGTTYYIVVSTSPSPQCGPFDISVTQSTTTAPSCNLNYTLTSIAASGSGNSGWTNLAFSDDRFADALTNLGFTFCFDGANYTQALVSSNGYIVFPGCYTIVPGGDATPTGYSPWSINASIPNTTNAPRNSIMLTWQDIDPGVRGTIRYKTTGTSPNRIFALQYSGVAMFGSCNTDNSKDFTGEMRLYETTNIIEFGVSNKQICTAWNNGAAIMGLHNYTGTLSVEPANHDYPTQWSETTTGYRFTPDCPTCTTPLGNEFISFEANGFDLYNRLDWKVEVSNEISSFEIEKSLNGADFYKIGEINSDIYGNTSFEFIDEHPNLINYYRIKSIDADGQESFTTILIVENNGIVIDKIWPNPHENNFSFTLSSTLQEEIKMEITDITGRILIQKTLSVAKGSNQFEVSTSTITSGVYQITLRDRNGNLIRSEQILKY